MVDPGSQIDAQPVCGRMQVGDTTDILLRPVGERFGQILLGTFDPLLSTRLALTAGQHQFRLVVKCAQQLPFPAIPNPGSDRLDIGNREDQQQFQALDRLNGCREIGDCLSVVEVP